MTGYQKWYSAMRRERRERRYANERELYGIREESFVEETLLFDELKAKNPSYVARRCVQKRSEKILKVACRYLEGFLSESSIRKRSIEIAKILGYNIENFAKGSRIKGSNQKATRSD